MSMNAYIHEPARETPIAGKADVIVAGGGIAGIAAALSAKRAGAKRVMLLEREYTLGGLATLGLVTVYLPLCDGCGRQVSFGLAWELMQLSISLGAEIPIPECWLEPGRKAERASKRLECRFNAALFASLAEKQLVEEGVEILYGVQVCGAVTQDDTLQAILVESKSEREAYLASAFVDATGDADLCQFAQLKTRTFGQGNVLASWYYALESSRAVLHPLGACDIPDNEKKPDAPRDERTRYTGLDVRELSAMMIASRGSSVRDFLKGGPLSDDHALITLATIPQVRMTRCPDIAQRMTLGMDKMRFSDSLGLISNWKKRGPVYEVPLSALRTQLRNLYTAGRCVPADDDMWDVTRVIPCCAVTGEAAGAAAALSGNVEKTQSLLRSRGIPLHTDELEG